MSDTLREHATPPRGKEAHGSLAQAGSDSNPAQEPPAGRNRLAAEKSPYLLQHASNPVDWYPWGQEAFERARREQRPLFLSIGYSTCHWCHVMERECFEDPEVAALLDEAFVCVKVDREERPDIDTVYMGACQMLNGSGGWPLTILMTPDQKPFFAATYIPKHSASGRLGLLELIPRVRRIWAERRAEVLESAERITAALREAGQGGAPGKICPETVARAVQQLGKAFDRQAGGFGGAPKFPVPHNLRLLLRQARCHGDVQAREMALFTLDRMREGGIYDHIGFGFHRYATDAAWLQPHFEKMLYDQALLVQAYAEAYLATGEERYRRTAREVCAYVLRDLTDPQGAFYSGEDADSEGQEGRFYLWTRAEIEGVLGGQEAEFFCSIFGVEPGGNHIEEATGELTGRSILHLGRPLEAAAAAGGLGLPELVERLERARALLFQARERRPRPGRDDKILTDWNGLMISGLALAARAFGDEELARSACRAAEFLLSRMLLAEGALLHRYREGEAAVRGFLDDYAFLAGGLIDLYQATGRLDFLVAARSLTRYQLEHFWDEERGGFFLTPDDAEPLLVRSRDTYDGALPSGNSLSLLNLARLGRILGEQEFTHRARRTADAFAPVVRQAPMAFTQVLLSVCQLRWPGPMVVVAGRQEAPETVALLRAARAACNPCGLVLFRGTPGEDGAILELMPHLAPLLPLGDRAAAHVQGPSGEWEPPLSDPAELRARLA